MARFTSTVVALCLTAAAVALAVSELAAEAQPGAGPSLKLYVFNCGHIRVDAPDRFSIEAHETDVRELIVPCYVVEHPAGRMLWDGGLPSSTAEADGWDGNTRLDRTLAEQLWRSSTSASTSARSTTSPSPTCTTTPRRGGQRGRLGATWLVQGAGVRRAMFGDGGAVPAAQPELYENLRDADRVILDGDHDVFGDGRVRILSAPGHTPGAPGALPRPGRHRTAGAVGRPLPLPPEPCRAPRARRSTSTASRTLASMERIEAFVEDVGATFWIEHDLALFQELDLAPAYYE